MEKIEKVEIVEIYPYVTLYIRPVTFKKKRLTNCKFFN